MITKETLFGQIEILPAGQIQVKLLKCVVEDGVVFPNPEPHRFVLEPGVDIDAALTVVSNHLTLMGFSGIKSPDTARIKRISAAEHTPEVIAAFLAARE